MDKKDEQILEVLKKDSSLATRQISKQTKLPITTVHNRIKKLRINGIIKNFTINIDHKKIGKTMSTITLVKLNYTRLRDTKRSLADIAQKIKQIMCVESVFIVIGDVDFMVKVRVKDMDELNNFLLNQISNVECVDRTQTYSILEELQ